MVGTLPLHSSTPISISSSDESIHLSLFALAEQGNQSRAIAARLQSRPACLHALLGSNSPTVIAARGGLAYNFYRRPFHMCSRAQFGLTVFRRQPFPLNYIAFDSSVKLSKGHRNMTGTRLSLHLPQHGSGHLCA